MKDFTEIKRRSSGGSRKKGFDEATVIAVAKQIRTIVKREHR